MYSSIPGDPTTNDLVDEATALLHNVELENAKARSVAGVLTSQPNSINLKVEQLTVTFHGRELVTDTTLELNMGRRYGLIGQNGSGEWLGVNLEYPLTVIPTISGKSSILQAIYYRELPIPDHIDMFLVSREMPATDKSVSPLLNTPQNTPLHSPNC
jgi:ATP-binding cassette, subfamily F, member 2